MGSWECWERPVQYNKGLVHTVLITVQVHGEGFLHWHKAFNLSVRNISVEPLLVFRSVLRRILNFFFPTCKDKLCMKATLNITHWESVCVCERCSLDCHTHTHTKMEALKPARSEATVCRAGPNMPLHSDHRVCAAVTVSCALKRTNDSNNSDSFWRKTVI